MLPPPHFLLLLIIILMTVFSYYICKEKPLKKKSPLLSPVWCFKIPGDICTLKLLSCSWPDSSLQCCCQVQLLHLLWGCYVFGSFDSVSQKFFFTPAGFLSPSESMTWCVFIALIFLDFGCCQKVLPSFELLLCCCVVAVRLACWETVRTGWWSTKCLTSPRLVPWRFQPSTLTHTTGQDLWLLFNTIREKCLFHLFLRFWFSPVTILQQMCIYSWKKIQKHFCPGDFFNAMIKCLNIFHLTQWFDWNKSSGVFTGFTDCARGWAEIHALTWLLRFSVNRWRITCFTSRCQVLNHSLPLRLLG